MRRAHRRSVKKIMLSMIVLLLIAALIATVVIGEARRRNLENNIKTSYNGNK